MASLCMIFSEMFTTMRLYCSSGYKDWILRPNFRPLASLDTSTWALRICDNYHNPLLATVTVNLAHVVFFIGPERTAQSRISHNYV